MTTVTGTIVLRIRGVEVSTTLTVPEKAAHPRRMLPALQRMTDDIVGAMVAAVTEPVSCQKGCGACCSQLVPVSALESRNVKKIVAGLPGPRRETVERRFAEAAEKLAGAGLLEDLRQPQGSLHELGHRYFALRIPCPFLEEGACSIHADRPLSCREYLVTSPAANCSAPSAGTIRMVPMPAKVSNALIQISREPWVALILALETRDTDRLEHRTGTDVVDEVVRYLAT